MNQAVDNCYLFLVNLGCSEFSQLLFQLAYLVSQHVQVQLLALQLHTAILPKHAEDLKRS